MSRRHIAPLYADSKPAAPRPEATDGGIAVTVADLVATSAMLVEAPEMAGRRVGHALGRVLAGDDPTDALGLRCRPGERSPLTLARLERRDALIAAMAARHYKGMSRAEQARQIAGQIAAYERRAARLDQAFTDVPPAYRGTPREFLFRIAKLCARMPAERTVRLILAAQNGSERALLAASDPR